MTETTESAEKAERRYPVEPKAPPALAVDVGGSHVKVLLNGVDERRRFVSGPKLTAKQMVASVLEQTEDWSYECVTVGVPSPVRDNVVLNDPYNLGQGWAGFDFETAFGKPTKVINDATMQALGGYQGGRMLFLGLGTGLGSTMILEDVIAPMELGHLPFRKATFEDYVGEAGLERLGHKRWRKAVHETITRLAPRSSRTTSCSEAGMRPCSGTCRRTVASATTRTLSSAASGSGSTRARLPGAGSPHGDRPRSGRYRKSRDRRLRASGSPVLRNMCAKSAPRPAAKRPL